MVDLYPGDVDCYVQPGATGNAEILAMLERINKKLRRSRKKGRKGGKKGRKKKQSKWLKNALAYATPKAIDLIFEKMAKPQVYIMSAESQTKLALPEKIDRK